MATAKEKFLRGDKFGVPDIHGDNKDRVWGFSYGLTENDVELWYDPQKKVLKFKLLGKRDNSVFPTRAMINENNEADFHYYNDGAMQYGSDGEEDISQRISISIGIYCWAQMKFNFLIFK